MKPGNQVPTAKVHCRAFTLVELLVSIGIFTVITSIIVLNQRTFGGSIIINNLAHKVSLGIRQAQVYGISSRPTQAGRFDRKFGVHFSAAAPRYYVFFEDADDSGGYNGGTDSSSGCTPSSECLSVWRIEKGNSISKFCAGTVKCTDTGLIDSMDIMFNRPDPEPEIRGFKDSVWDSMIYPRASITIVSPDGLSKTVSVLPSGQVTVE